MVYARQASYQLSHIPSSAHWLTFLTLHDSKLYPLISSFSFPPFSYCSYVFRFFSSFDYCLLWVMLWWPCRYAAPLGQWLHSLWMPDLEERLLTHVVLMVISLPTNLPAHQQHTRIHFPLEACQHLLSLPLHLCCSHSNKSCVPICNSLIICDVSYIFFCTFCKGIFMQLYFQAFV